MSYVYCTHDKIYTLFLHLVLIFLLIQKKQFFIMIISKQDFLKNL